MRIKANLYSGRLFEYWEPKGATIRSYLEGGRDSSKMHTDGRINLELAVRMDVLQLCSRAEGRGRSSEI